MSHVFVFGHKSPVAAVKKAGKQVVSVASFATVIAVGVPPLPEALIVIESVDASVVIVTFVPATRVRVSEVESATMLDCPDTAIVENRFWSPVFVPLDVPEKVPD